MEFNNMTLEEINELGDKYYNEKKYKEAFQCFLYASEKGNAKAQYNLGWCYYHGYGVKQSYEEAARLYKLAVEQNYSVAQYNLGWCYYHGYGVKQSYEEAVRLYKLAAEQNYSVAQYNLGICYYHGYGVDKPDYEKAMEYFLLSKNKNYSRSFCRLGYLYFYGNGVEQDYLKAKEYFEKAIELGYDASYPLEICNRELGIEDTNNYAREFIESLDYSNYSKSIMSKINELFDSLPQTLDSKSKVFITSGLVSYYNFYRLQQLEYIKLDYTSCITPLLKALENEIKKYFIDKYMRYLEKNISVDNFENNYFKVRNKQGDYEYLDVEDRFNKFTLGEFKDLIGLKENISVFAIKDNKTYDDNRSNNRTTVIDLSMLKYLKEEVFDKDKFTWNIDGEIIDYLVNLNDVITFLTKEIRNPAAHDLIMSLEKAETTINYLLFTKKLLVTFYEKMK